MASISMTVGTWAPFPIAASAGQVTVTNNVSTGPIYVRFMVAGAIAREFKLQPSEQKLVQFPAGATAMAICGFNQSMTVA